MPTMPNNDLYNSGETITTLVQKLLLPELPFYTRIPFTPSPNKYITATQESYSADDDPENLTPSEGVATIHAAWPEVNVSLGTRLSLNTTMRKTRISFTRDDINDPLFASIARKSYGRAAWLIAKQVNTNLVTTLTTATTGYAAPTTAFDAKTGGVWSGSGNPLGDIRAIAEDISSNSGFRLSEIIVHRTNFYELMDYLETDDQDMGYAREGTANRSFYNEQMYLKVPGCTVTGIADGLGLSEGAILGIGTFQGSPVVEQFAYRDPEFTYGVLPVQGEENMGVPDVPLNIHKWVSDDSMNYFVGAWLDSVAHVGMPKGIWYKSSGI